VAQPVHRPLQGFTHPSKLPLLLLPPCCIDVQYADGSGGDGSALLHYDPSQHPLPLLLPCCVDDVQYADGSGGNGSALRHYEATGCKYPLVVKLGTITPAGADVYSYAGGS
jgi:uncharacterized UBP type Zn finger protein